MPRPDTAECSATRGDRVPRPCRPRPPSRPRPPNWPRRQSRPRRRTGDRRISGACASLAGLEDALARADPQAVDLALRRILCLHAVIFGFDGVPLIYMGDEIGLVNDPTYLRDPARADDNRWMHRPAMDWRQAARRAGEGSPAGRIFRGLAAMASARARLPALHAEAAAEPVWTYNDHVLGVLRHSQRGRILLLANLTEHDQEITADRLAALGFPGPRRDHLASRPIPGPGPIHLAAYEVLWMSDVE